jgi:hypothetical protein
MVSQSFITPAWCLIPWMDSATRTGTCSSWIWSSWCRQVRSKCSCRMIGRPADHPESEPAVHRQTMAVRAVPTNIAGHRRPLWRYIDGPRIIPHDRRAILTADQLHGYIYVRLVRGRPRGGCARTIAGSHGLLDALVKLLCQHECSLILMPTCHIAHRSVRWSF